MPRAAIPQAAVVGTEMLKALAARGHHGLRYGFLFGCIVRVEQEWFFVELDPNRVFEVTH